MNNNNIKKTVFILLFSFLTVNIAESKEGVFETLKKSINKSVEIATNFNILNQDGMEGTLIATNLGEYQIVLQGRIVTSDSKSIWNYAPNEKKVIITSVDDMDYISVSNLFKMFANDYTLKNMKKSLDTELGKTYKILLKPNEDTNLPDLTLWLERNNPKIMKMIAYDEGNGEVKILFSNMKYKKKKSNYKFKIPKDTEIIDLR